MTDLSRIKPSHTARASYIYVRQSTPSQVEHNYTTANPRRASTRWPTEPVNSAGGRIRSSLLMTTSVSPEPAQINAPVSRA